MIEISLEHPAFAIFESTLDWARSRRYVDRIRLNYYTPESFKVGWQGLSDDEADALLPTVQSMSSAVWVTPDGYARLETLHQPGNITTVTIVTPGEVFQTHQSEPSMMRRQRRHPDPLSRQFDEIFGRPYPNEALALLNPFLMMRDYTCVPGSARHEICQGHTVTMSRYTHNPDCPRNASDDPERLGSMDVDVHLADDIPILLGWDALDGDTPFEHTRITRLELEASLHGKSLFSPETAMIRMHPDT